MARRRFAVELGFVAFLLAIVLLGVVVFRAIFVATQPPKFQILHHKFQGREPNSSKSILERYRLVAEGRASAKDIEILREEREQFGYEANLRPSPGMMDMLFGGDDRLPPDLDGAVERGYAVRVSSRLRFWTRRVDVAFIQLPDLPQQGQPSKPRDEGLFAKAIRRVAYSHAVARFFVAFEAPVESVSYDLGAERIREHVAVLRAGIEPSDAEHLADLDAFERLMLDIHRGNHERPLRDKLGDARDLASRAREVVTGARSAREAAKQAVTEVFDDAGVSISKEERHAIEAEVESTLVGYQRENELRQSEKGKAPRC
jgi:hypothetical protein